MPKLQGSKPEFVLVAGGTGFVGGIIARSLVAAGWPVIVPSRSADRLADLTKACQDGPGSVLGLAMSGDHPHHEAARQVRGAGLRVGAVVAALGGWSKGGALIELSDQEWQDAVGDHLTSHFQAMQAYVPLLAGATDPTYITLNGAAATQPMVGSGAVSLTGAAQHMLTAVMRAERPGETVRFHELSLMAAVAGDGRNQDPSGEIVAGQIAAAIAELIADRHCAAFLAIDAGGR